MSDQKNKNPYPGLMRHVTAVLKTADEVLQGAPGRRQNLCPLAPSVYDLDIVDVRPMSAEERIEWSLCPLCLRALAGWKQ